MTTRYGIHDTKDVPDPQNSASLDFAPPDHTMAKRDKESFDKYSEEAHTHYLLAELLEQFWQLQDQFSNLRSATLPPTHMLELMQLTDKLQHLAMTFQPHPTHQPIEEPMDNTMQAYTDTLHSTQREANLTMTLLHDIPMFDGQDSSKLEDWFLDIKTTTDILTESHICLAEAKSHSLT